MERLCGASDGSSAHFPSPQFFFLRSAIALDDPCGFLGIPDPSPFEGESTNLLFLFDPLYVSFQRFGRVRAWTDSHDEDASARRNGALRIAVCCRRFQRGRDAQSVWNV